MDRGFSPIARLGIADALYRHDTVAADNPIARFRRDRRSLACRQCPRESFAFAAIGALCLVFVKFGRADFEIEPRLLEHRLPNLAVAGQYQRHSAPVEKSVEKSP